MNKLETLIRKLIGNTASEQDQDELKELINDDSNLRELERIVDEQLELTRTKEEGLTPPEGSSIIENIIRVTSKRKQFRFNLATVSVLLLLAVASVWISIKKSDQIVLQQPDMLLFQGKDYIRLPDGTTVLMNEGTEIRYHATANEREVFLNGEAYFDVAHDPSKPFTVHTGEISTRVLGTAFNIKAYPGQNEISVSVTRGKVQVGDNERTYVILKANEQLAVNINDRSFVKENLDITKLEWKENFMVFDEITLEQAAALISKKYGVKIRFDRPQLKNCDIRAKFLNDESLLDVLEVVSGVTGIKYTIDASGVIIFSGRGCN